MTDADRVVSIRRLRAEDRERWTGLWRAYLSFYRAELAEDVTAQTFERLHRAERGLVGLVAVDAADRPIGIAHLVFHSVTWSASEYCYLEDLFVEPGHRGGQVATALFDAIDQHARDRGVERVYWHTQQFNGAARSLYDTVGQLTSLIVYERQVG